ncbi:hypothetical protein AX16_010441 [Volvariella volvacea WC 439]|nr:hypothetical protein AX16_010441 [Volvariella volvacea WC 439]
MVFVLTERDSNGRLHKIPLQGSAGKTRDSASQVAQSSAIGPKQPSGVRRSTTGFLAKVFLPTGYPASVTPGNFQILNALQAFCSSLAGLLSSRAVLEGFGVGDANATATNAVLLTIVQDVFSRFTTIVGAYYFGSSLYPEAKTYRFLADILNDCAIVLDALLPLLPISESVNILYPSRLIGLNTELLVPSQWMRTGILCMSASCRSLCGVTSGGSRASIALHFASPAGATGDLGDLNAKDSSKETVLALFGMLLGSIVVPSLTTPWRTYSTLFLLVFLHLLINYLGVKGLQLRTLNRQRMSLLWYTYRTNSSPGTTHRLLSPTSISGLERVLGRPGLVRDSKGRVIGEVAIGSSFGEVVNSSSPNANAKDRVLRLVELFKDERYVIWLDSGSHHRGLTARVHVCLKAGYAHRDLLKGWCHAVEVCLVVQAGKASNSTEVREKRVEGSDERAGAGEHGVIERANANVDKTFDEFVKVLKGAGWDLGSSGLSSDGTLLLSGVPKGVIESTVD